MTNHRLSGPSARDIAIPPRPSMKHDEVSNSVFYWESLSIVNFDSDGIGI
ncbi:hypothetical protein [Marinigracilibium pacificum]|uniref:Uncharacterized protein n=1 Tax=Marinigracilibium pacificum TaxID=2729599 RepID=A0A848J632_9BACT|nr:hypothetical protein [Marinigracilibium pacificum]NMM50915.1 hypothetical protein [Marinigracilibium pacificum]